MVEMTLDQAMQNPFLKSLMAPYLQPAAQLQETQAAAGAAGASAALQSTEQQTAQVKAQQAQALQGLRSDLQKGTTLKDALSKYTSLGMSADDVFKQYLAESPYGTPKETPTELQHLGISAGALGKIGDTGSFMDIYNTKNAITELRNLEGLYKEAGPVAQSLPIIGSQLPQSKAYQAAKIVFGNHLASLIPGASGAQATGQSLLGQLPDLANPFEPAAASGQFNAIEKQLLASKGYKYSDIGLPEPQGTQQATSQQPTTQGPQSGGDLLKTILTNAGSEVKGLYESSPFTGVGSPLAQPAKQAEVVQSGIQTPGATIDLYKGILTDPINTFKKQPISTTMAVLGPLLGLKAGEPAESAGMTEEGVANTATAAQDVFAKAPGKMQQFFQPGKAKAVIGQIRDTLIDNADKAGKTVSGDQVAQGFRTWADQAKLSNPADAQAIEDAATSFEKEYAGKTFKPSQLKSIYDNIEKGYTAKGQPRTATSAYIDRGVQDVLQQQLEGAAPGFAKTTDLFSQTYQAEKSPVRGIAKRAAGVGLGLGGLDFVRHILGL